MRVESRDDQPNVLRGLVASRGTIHGIATIVRTLNEGGKLEGGRPSGMSFHLAYLVSSNSPFFGGGDRHGWRVGAYGDCGSRVRHTLRREYRQRNLYDRGWHLHNR